MAISHSKKLDPAAPSGRDDPDLFARRLSERRAGLTAATLRVLRFIDQNRIATLANSAAELAQRTQTSDATVIRAVQALGFSGLPELRQALSGSLQRGSTLADGMRRTLEEVGESADRAISLGLDTNRDGLELLRSDETRAKISAAVSLLHPAERIVLFGIGPSAPLAHYSSVLLRRSGRRTDVLDRTGIGLADQLLDLRPTDALLVLAYGRAYREVVTVLDEAARLGVPVALITDTLEGKLAARAQVVIPAQRGLAERVALHGTTLICLEALVLGLAASAKDQAVATLERLNELRQSLSRTRVDLG
jgi:DNA-binding MurR/RpiR family transcriptional regulator